MTKEGCHLIELTIHKGLGPMDVLCAMLIAWLVIAAYAPKWSGTCMRYIVGTFKRGYRGER